MASTVAIFMLLSFNLKFVRLNYVRTFGQCSGEIMVLYLATGTSVSDFGTAGTAENF